MYNSFKTYPENFHQEAIALATYMNHINTNNKYDFTSGTSGRLTLAECWTVRVRFL